MKTQIKQNLIETIKTQWSSWLVIAAILAAGSNYGATVARMNYKIESLETQIKETKELLNSKYAALENQRLDSLYLNAEVIILFSDVPSDIDKFPLHRSVLKSACQTQVVREKLTIAIGEKVNQFCNYARR